MNIVSDRLKIVSGNMMKTESKVLDYVKGARRFHHIACTVLLSVDTYLKE